MKGAVLRDKRLKKGLSQYALSVKSKVSRFKISQYENGYGDLTVDEKVRIKKKLK